MYRIASLLDRPTLFCYYLPATMSQQQPSQPGAQASSFLPKMIQQCPLCTKEYAQTDVLLVGEADGTQLIHITCPSCKHAIVALIVLSQVGVSSIGMLTDLNAQELRRLLHKTPIADTTVLGFHDLLVKQPSHLIYLLSQQTV